jgi:plasmid stabilization system protein ParE
MMKFAVHISLRAQRDIREISQWIVMHSRPGAMRWLDELEKVVDRLADAAESYALADESRWLPFPVREISFRTPKGRRYRAIFAIDGNRVDLLSIRAPGQPPVTAADFEE